MEEEVYELLMRVRDDVRAGRIDDALLLLDRIIDRKWADITECDGQYRMFDADAPIEPLRIGFANALGLQVAVHAPGAPR